MQPDAPTPDFDPQVLLSLVDEPGPQGREFVHGLARTYLRLLPVRVQRLVGAIGGADGAEGAEPDIDDAMDACLSLKVASTMTGAGGVAAIAAWVEGDLRGHDLAGARAHARLLPVAEERTAAAVAAYLAAAEVA